jgi:hypothetical protein
MRLRLVRVRRAFVRCEFVLRNLRIVLVMAVTVAVIRLVLAVSILTTTVAIIATTASATAASPPPPPPFAILLLPLPLAVMFRLIFALSVARFAAIFAGHSARREVIAGCGKRLACRFTGGFAAVFVDRDLLEAW